MTESAQRQHMVYAYAVLRPTPEAARAAAVLRGVADEQVGLVETGDLAAAVGPVPAEEFEEGALKAGLEELPRLEALARGHHGVVAGLAPLGAVLPLRLATVYRDEDRVRQVLQERRDQFLPLLERLAGHLEWGVKVYTDPTDPTDSLASDAAVSAGATGGEEALSPGRAYLAARRRRRRGAEEAWQTAARTAARIAEEAGGLAVGRVAHRPQRGELAQVAGGETARDGKSGGETAGGGKSGGGKPGGENIANDAYLVPADRAEEFRSRVLAAAEGQPGVRVEVTGPWAPYSFALPPEPESAARPEPV
ncbi:GvpL/GvpF family gas vesicle protein [Streptomyces sp. OE57]|uniref:GvpL/GvpF family gas vesicle protein n=1 Tax=Streptomyces lacaronensis TaxID=3379885 RepID=UPI0039B7379B